MNIEVTDQGEYHLAVLDGVVDEKARESFGEFLHPLIEAADGRLLIDLRGTPRIDSPGIGHLVSLVSRANTKGSRVVLVNPTPFVASIFQVTRLDRFFDIADSIDDGVQRLLA